MRDENNIADTGTHIADTGTDIADTGTDIADTGTDIADTGTEYGVIILDGGRGTVVEAAGAESGTKWYQ